MGHFITDRLHSKGDGSAFYPYGESKTGAAGDDREQFATYTRDQSSGLDHADQRWYSSRLGRFLTTDPFDSSFSDARPTSANRYSYVESDPGNLIDPTGLLLESPGGSSSRTFDPCYLDGRDFCGGNIGGGGGGPVLSSPQDLALAYGLISPGQSLNTGTVNWELLLQSICAVFVLPSAHTAVLGNLAGLSSHSLVPAAVAIPILIDIGVSAGTVINTTGATITVGVLWATLQELFRKKQSHPIDYPRGGIPGERDSNGNCVMTSPPYPRVKWRAQGNAHGSTAGYHWHWMDWDLNLATCMWFAKRRAGPTDPGPAYQEIGH
jgi:RHS repeat-associated protein